MTDGVPGTDRREATRVFEEHRDPLIGVAYRVLGRITDAEDVALAESVSMAMLVVLETLSPLERAVFVLREAFWMPYTELAGILPWQATSTRTFPSRASPLRW